MSKANSAIYLDSESVFGQIEERRASGALNQFINRDQPIYQASSAHPGLLEQIRPDSTITVGWFQVGEFQSHKV